MRKVYLLLTFVCFTLCVNAQYGPLSLPLGIDVTGIDKKSVREPSKNEDATRYLEKTVKEDPENLVKIEKLLNAGASAYVTYEMIDKKQYEVMELMYKNNSKLIRYSQMLHYACANCTDTAMIDFLIGHGASLDLCGSYCERVNGTVLRGVAELSTTPYFWNKDSKYYYTPQDIAYRRGNKTILCYIIKKYKKYPTTVGLADYIYQTLANDRKVNRLINLLNGDEDFYNIVNKGKGNDSKSLAQLLNTELPTIKGGLNQSFGYCNILCRAIERLGVYRNNGNTEVAAKYEELVRLLIDKGAQVNLSVRQIATLQINSHGYANGYGSGTFNSPMLTAMKYHNMMDIVKLLKAKGAPLTVQYLAPGCVLKERNIEGEAILDEYKEAILLGEL